MNTLKLKVGFNKKNGQYSITLPKKKFKKKIVPKEIKISW